MIFVEATACAVASLSDLTTAGSIIICTLHCQRVLWDQREMPFFSFMAWSQW